MRGWRMEMGIWWVREGWTRLRGGVMGRMIASMARRYTKFNFGNFLCCYGSADSVTGGCFYRLRKREYIVTLIHTYIHTYIQTLEAVISLDM